MAQSKECTVYHHIRIPQPAPFLARLYGAQPQGLILYQHLAITTHLIAVTTPPQARKRCLVVVTMPTHNGDVSSMPVHFSPLKLNVNSSHTTHSIFQRNMVSIDWIIIGSCNGLAPVRCQPITWTNADLSIIGPWGTSFCGLWIKMHKFSDKKSAFENICKKAAVIFRAEFVNCASVAYLCVS